MKVGGLKSIFQVCILHFIVYCRPGKFWLKKVLGVTPLPLGWHFHLFFYVFLRAGRPLLLSEPYTGTGWYPRLRCRQWFRSWSGNRLLSAWDCRQAPSYWPAGGNAQERDWPRLAASFASPETQGSLLSPCTPSQSHNHLRRVCCTSERPFSQTIDMLQTNDVHHKENCGVLMVLVFWWWCRWCWWGWGGGSGGGGVKMVMVVVLVEF